MESRKTRVDEAARLAAIHAKLPVTDVAALDNQVLVKKAAELLFAERERCALTACSGAVCADAACRGSEANAERLAMDILAQRLEAERLARKAEEQRRLGAFQAQQASSYAPQKFEASTYSPASLPESAASLRSFAGEDPQFVERKRMQADQQAGWCAAAGASKQALAEQAAAAAAADHALLQSHFAASDVAFRAQDAARARSVREGAAANLALAFEKREGDARAAAERAATHLIALVVDDGPASGVPRTEFRGYTTQQQAEVLAGQQAQRCVPPPAPSQSLRRIV